MSKEIKNDNGIVAAIFGSIMMITLSMSGIIFGAFALPFIYKTAIKYLRNGRQVKLAKAAIVMATISIPYYICCIITFAVD